MKLDDESLEKTLKEVAPELQAMRASPVEPPPDRLEQLEKLRQEAFKSASGRSEEKRPQVVSRVDEFLGYIFQFLSGPRLVPVCIACSVLVIGAFLVLNTLTLHGPQSSPLAAGKPIIQLAMLDTVGMTRGAATNPALVLGFVSQQPSKETRETSSNAAVVLQQTQAASEVKTFSEMADLKRWLGDWSADAQQPVVKVVYDRDAGEVRVFVRCKGKPLIKKVFPVKREEDLPTVLTVASSFIEGQTP